MAAKSFKKRVLYDPNKNETRPMRSKEEANDYRYFPDPDLLPLIITDELIENMRRELPELPQQKRQRFMDQYGLSAYDASILVSSKDMAEYYESTVQRIRQSTQNGSKLGRK